MFEPQRLPRRSVEGSSHSGCRDEQSRARATAAAEAASRGLEPQRDIRADPWPCACASRCWRRLNRTHRPPRCFDTIPPRTAEARRVGSCAVRAAARRGGGGADDRSRRHSRCRSHRAVARRVGDSEASCRGRSGRRRVATAMQRCCRGVDCPRPRLLRPSRCVKRRRGLRGCCCSFAKLRHQDQHPRFRGRRRQRARRFACRLYSWHLWGGTEGGGHQ